MKSRIRTGLGLSALALQAVMSVVVAAPIQYSFTTGATPFVFSTGGVPPPPSVLSDCAFCGGVSGTFAYDPEAPFVAINTGINVNGSFQYAGFSPESVSGNPSSITALTAQIGVYSFSDPNGSTTIANDTATWFGSAPNVDSVLLAFDPAIALGNLFVRNISGFDIEGYTLVAVSMQWIESLAMTSESPGFPNVGAPTPDFLTGQDLPGAPPSFSGRFWLEFQNINDPSLSFIAFFNNLQVTQVPEPAPYAMLLAGLALLGFQTRRRMQL